MVVARKPDGSASLVRLADGRTLAVLGGFTDGSEYPAPGHLSTANPYPTGEFSFSKDGSRLITRDRFGSVSIWDAGSGRRIRQLINIGKEGIYVQSPSSAWLVTIPEIGSAELWDLSGGRRIVTLGKFKPSEGVQVSFLDLKSDSFIASNAFGEHGEIFGDPPYSGARMEIVNPEARLIIEDDKSSALWDVNRASLLAKFERTFEDTIGVNWVSVKDRMYVVKSSPSQHLELWDVSRAKRIADLGLDGEMTFARDGNRAWLTHKAYSDGPFELWDTRTGQRLLTCEGGVEGFITERPGGIRLVTMDKSKRYTLWRVGPH